MKARRRRPDPRDRGFVLVGVIMFVLALTILGLSLYGLSSFEVDFIQDSIDREQAFYDASGGLERAKWILAQRGTLQSVKNGIPDGNGIVYARAWRPVHGVQDSIGVINWSSSDKIAIRVKAVRGTRQGQTGTARSMVECTYTPNEIKSLYSNLFTSAGKVVVAAGWTNPVLQGTAWQNDPDTTTWTSRSTRLPPAHVTVGGVPFPEVPAFLARFPTTLLNPVHYSSPGNSKVGSYDFTDVARGYNPIPGSRILMFRNSDEATSDPGFALYNHDKTATLNIGDRTVIWLIDGGAWFEASLNVTALPGARLIMIVSAGTAPPPPASGITSPVGIWFDSHMDLPTGLFVPMIFVSDGLVSFSQLKYQDLTLYSWLSVFAADVHMYLQKDPVLLQFYHPSDLDSSVLDDLIANQLLPNTSPGQNHRLDKVAGTWSVVLKSDPDN